MNRLIISAASPLTKHVASSSSRTLFAPLSITTARTFTSTATPNESNKWHGTTILCVRKNNQVCMIGDGMVSMGNVTIKPNAKKIRRLYPKTVGGRRHPSSSPSSEKEEEEDENESTIVGFAGSTADAFTLLERLEGKLDEYPGQLTRSCVELAKGWRTDKYLRRLEASLIVADENVSLEITGNGDVLEPHDGVLAVGSGGFYAQAAARALTYNVPDMSAEDVARKAMDIASDMCVYTNKEYIVETITIKEKEEEGEGEEGENEEKKE